MFLAILEGLVSVVAVVAGVLFAVSQITQALRRLKGRH